MYKIDKLLKLEQKIFHTADLGLLWEISNKNTLYTTISRLVKKGVLISLQKGLYATVSLEQLDPLKIGPAFLHRFAYLSTETVLAKEGLISQVIYPLTFISDVSRKFKINEREYLVRRIKKEILFNPYGMMEINGVFIATPERAVADLLYFDPHYHFDRKEKIDWEKVKLIKKEVGY